MSNVDKALTEAFKDHAAVLGKIWMFGPYIGASLVIDRAMGRTIDDNPMGVMLGAGFVSLVFSALTLPITLPATAVVLAASPVTVPATFAYKLCKSPDEGNTTARTSFRYT
ncbi:MAG: hypothetical protein KBD64_01750 [Gammaproteobacteria bacterium]|nr:hypothetical protein [Gammaproteobacteria bacterium]